VSLSDPLLFPLPGNEPLAVGLAGALNAELGVLDAREFPDGESYVRIVTDPRDRDVVLVATLRHPDSQFLRVAFAADAARELGAQRVGLVAPYLAYLRQDRRFHRGEAVTSRTFARLVSRAVDWVVAVDPHLHRLTSLAEVYDIPAIAVDAAPLMGEWVRQYVERPTIVGPDVESEQWARVVAEAAQAPLIVLEKERVADDDVRVTLPRRMPSVAGIPVLVDDIVSTGRTISAAARRLRGAGFASPVCVAVHAVFADDAMGELTQAGVTRVVTTNTIGHPTNAIDVVAAIASAFTSSRPDDSPRRRSGRRVVLGRPGKA
jgi:ribose-phosphate pyrophosphokinase